jgi:hypothetical protein
MNIVEGIIWISIGFIPMFGGLELAWRLAAKRLKLVNKTERAHV